MTYTIELPNGETVDSFAAAEAAGYPFACEQFALCENAAVDALPHPVLGAVPSCQRCIDKIASLA